MGDNDLPVFSFLPNWQQGITETLEWITDVLRSEISGHEQRRAVRLTPRRYFEARFNPIDEARSFMDLWLQRFGAQEFLLPLWHDRAKLTESAASGTARLTFDNTYREFETLGLALLRNGLFSYQVVQIIAQDDTGLDLSASLESTWGLGSVVYPLRVAALDNLQAVLAAMTRRVGRASLSFRLTRENVYPLGVEALTVFDGFPLVTLEPNRQDDLEARFEQMYQESDFNLGRVYRRTEANRAFAAQFYNWQARGRQQHHELRQTLYRLNGRQKAVWMPSFNKDVVLSRTLSSDSDRMDIRQIGYRYLGGPIAGRNRIVLNDDTGTRQIVAITGTSEALALGEDRLNLSANAGFTASAGREGSFLDLVRMDQDRVEITHYTDSDGVCEASAAFRSFTQGRDPAGVLVQPYPVAEFSDVLCGTPVEESPCINFDVFPGWYMKCEVEVVEGPVGLATGFVDTGAKNQGWGGFTGDSTQSDRTRSDGLPLVRMTPDGKKVTVYFYEPESALATELWLQLQWLGGTKLAQIRLVRVRFNATAWRDGGFVEIGDVTGGGGATPKAVSELRRPGTPSFSTRNPFPAKRIFPTRWFFDA